MRTFLLLLVALVSVALADFCGPAYSLTLKQCKHRIDVCAPQNATLKFTGRGCRTLILVRAEMSWTLTLLTAVSQELKDTFLAMVGASATNIAGTLVPRHAAVTNSATGIWK